MGMKRGISVAEPHSFPAAEADPADAPTGFQTPELDGAQPESFDLDGAEWPEQLAGTEDFTDDAVRDYLRRLRQYDLLTAGQEVELAQEIEAGLYAEQLLTDGTSRPGLDIGELRTIVLLGERAADALLHGPWQLCMPAT